MKKMALGKDQGRTVVAYDSSGRMPRISTRFRLRYVLLWALTPVALLPVIGLAAESGAPQSAGDSVASMTSSTPEAGVPDFGNVGSDEGFAPPGKTPESPDKVYSQPSPFEYGAASYQPGFSGCAAIGLNFRGVGTGSNRAELTRPRGPAGEQGRFARLSVSGSETYTDNLNLAPDDRAVSDFITEISPRLDACANTGRARGSLVYQLQEVLYHSNKRFNDVYNNVAGDTTIELLAGHLYLGADTRYDQSTIDPSLGFSRSNALSPRNQTSVWTSNISPYYVQNLGPAGNANLRYRYGKVIYTDSNVPDSTVNGVSFNLTSPRNLQALSWQVNAFTQSVHRSGGDQRDFFRRFNDGTGPALPPNIVDNRADQSNTTHFDKATLELGYQVTQSLKLLALGGAEDDYRPDGSNDRLGNAIYNGGFRWASAKNSLEARIGHRFFGTSYFVRAAHTGRVLDASLDYREDPSTQGLNAANSNGITSNTAFTQPNTSLFDRGVFVQKRLLATLAFDTGLSRTTFSAFDEKREFVGDLPDEKSVGGDIRINYQFLPRLAIVPRGGFERRHDRGDIKSDIADAGVGLVRIISPTAQAGLSYGHSWRRADQASREYDENRVILQIQKGF